MTTPSVFHVTDVLDIADGVVVGPAWTDDHSRELLRSLRMVRAAAPDSPDAEEHCDDIAVASRIFHEVLALNPPSVRWPVFTGSSARHSLFKAAIRHAHMPGDLSALVRLSDRSALMAANVARWMLRLPQQTSSMVVFATPPSGVAPRVRTRSRYATAREVAVAC